MQILLNIAENGNVELTKDDGCKLIQGECCVTEFAFNFPATIKGVAVSEYEKYIEFAECKDLGECVKFMDKLEGGVYELREPCTRFTKIMVQLVLEKGDIKWKTLPFVLEFNESINAEGTAAIQTQLLNLTEIITEWEDIRVAFETFIKGNALRIVSRLSDVPTADEESEGDTIFYLGVNADTPPYFTYGHYYRCNRVGDFYVWVDLTCDPSLAGVADGVREINKNQTLQFWKGTKAELEQEAPQENVAYIAEDEEFQDVLNEYAPNLNVHSADYADVATIINPTTLTEESAEYPSASSTDKMYIPISEKGVYVVTVARRYGGSEYSYYTGVITIPQISKEANGVMAAAIGNTAFLRYDRDVRKIICKCGSFADEGGSSDILFVQKIADIPYVQTAKIKISAWHNSTDGYTYITAKVLEGGENVTELSTLVYMGAEMSISAYNLTTGAISLKKEIDDNFALLSGEEIVVGVETWS